MYCCIVRTSFHDFGKYVYTRKCMVTVKIGDMLQQLAPPPPQKKVQ